MDKNFMVFVPSVFLQLIIYHNSYLLFTLEFLTYTISYSTLRPPYLTFELFV